MASWFSPETPKIVGPWRRCIHPSGRNRSYGLLVAVLVLLVLYFIGCSGAGIQTMLDLR
ncbi:MAG TPA: hypothetical protein VFL57_06880 [Bryobacteraceae bacterium]|nr:hypothetical protein [Bryobacteraceae bacterium]